MRHFLHISLITILLFVVSCGTKHADVKKNLEELSSGETDTYTAAYTYATYLSTTKTVKAEEAIPLISDLISLGYPTAARYCIDNLERNGIHSSDLLALRGLCYQHELQPELAEVDLEAALSMDPHNEKIRTLMNNFRKQSATAEDLPLDEILFQKGVSFIQNQHFDSALSYLNQASEVEHKPEYEVYRKRLEQIREGDSMIHSTSGNYRAYMLKSQGLAALNLFAEAQGTLDAGLLECPDNLNLVLAKALVWVQEGESEIAKIYLWEQEQQGIAIDPTVKQKILQTQN